VVVTLADWKLTAGLEPGVPVHETKRGELVEIYWPAAMNGALGWWWAIGTLEGAWLAGGWGLGGVRDRNMDIARALVRFAPARAS
jgi:hypothetical protein